MVERVSSDVAELPPELTRFRAADWSQRVEGCEGSHCQDGHCAKIICQVGNWRRARIPWLKAHGGDVLAEFADYQRDLDRLRRDKRS
jgi:hypothetical protein